MIIIKINSELENEKVQSSLFKIGYEWGYTGHSIREFDSYPIYLYLDYLSKKGICWSFSEDRNIMSISSERFLLRFSKKGKLKI